MKKSIARFSMLGIALLYLIFGLMFCIDPVKFASGLGFSDLTRETSTEIRAIYGGLEIAIAVGVVYLLRKSQEIAAGYLLVITFAGFAGGRILGLTIDGFSGNHGAYLSLELILGILSAWSLKQFLRG